MTPQNKKCKECLLLETYNPKYPLCNYHQGIQQGKQELWDYIKGKLDYCDDEGSHQGLTIGDIKEIKKRFNLK